MDLLDEWNGIADFLANMIEKYAVQMDLDSLPDPDVYYELKRTQMKNTDLEICRIIEKRNAA